MTVPWSEISVFVGAVSASIATIIFATQHSRCRHITCLCGSCDREIPPDNERPTRNSLKREESELGYVAP